MEGWSLVEDEGFILLHHVDALLGLDSHSRGIDHASAHGRLDVALGIDEAHSRGEVLGLDRVGHAPILPSARVEVKASLTLGPAAGGGMINA